MDLQRVELGGQRSGQPLPVAERPRSGGRHWPLPTAPARPWVVACAGVLSRVQLLRRDFLRRDGHRLTLPYSGSSGRSDSAYGVNDSGVVVGTSLTGTSTTPATTRSFTTLAATAWCRT